MGRGKQGSLKYPLGIKPRDFAHETRLQISFSYRGVPCRELLPPQAVTQTAINLAAGKRAQILLEIAEGRFDYPSHFPNSERGADFAPVGDRQLIGPLLDAQAAAYEKQRDNGQLSRSTVTGYVKAINSDRMAYWRELTLAEATPKALRDWIKTFTSITAKRARNLFTPLRAVFEDAVNDELLDVDPFTKVAVKRLLTKTTVASDYDPDPFPEEERDKLIAAARPDEAPTVRFWFQTGLRPGELIAIPWPKIDRPRREAVVDAAFVEGELKDPKTQAGIRRVRLTDEALAALAAQRALFPDAQGPIWLNPTTGQPWTGDAQLRKSLWMPLCARAGVKYRNPYQARHTFASSLLTRGENPWFVAEQLGHTDVQLVYRVYGSFISEDYKRQQQQSSAA